MLPRFGTGHHSYFQVRQSVIHVLINSFRKMRFETFLPYEKRNWHHYKLEFCIRVFDVSMFYFIYLSDGEQVKKYFFFSNKIFFLSSTIGMNSLVVYVCHDVFYRFFPVNWHMENPMHWHLLLKAVWDTAIWVVLAYILYRKRIFIAL